MFKSKARSALILTICAMIAQIIILLTHGHYVIMTIVTLVGVIAMHVAAFHYEQHCHARNMMKDLLRIKKRAKRGW
jgi:uncharacterized membrane protein